MMIDSISDVDVDVDQSVMFWALKPRGIWKRIFEGLHVFREGGGCV